MDLPSNHREGEFLKLSKETVRRVRAVLFLGIYDQKDDDIISMTKKMTVMMIKKVMIKKIKKIEKMGSN